MRRKMFIAVSAVAAAFVIAAGAVAATTPLPSYQLAGLAIGGSAGTNTVLAGTAIGSNGDRGFWRATVTIAPLTSCSALGSSCAITAGTITLTSNNGSSLIGSVQGGTATLSDQAVSTCSRSQYTVRTSVLASDGTTWQLTATVTKLGLAVGRTCFSLGATVQATLASGPSGPMG